MAENQVKTGHFLRWNMTSSISGGLLWRGKACGFGRAKLIVMQPVDQRAVRAMMPLHAYRGETLDLTITSNWLGCQALRRG